MDVHGSVMIIYAYFWYGAEWSMRRKRMLLVVIRMEITKSIAAFTISWKVQLHAVNVKGTVSRDEFLFWWSIKINQYFLYMRWWFLKFSFYLLLWKHLLIFKILPVPSSKNVLRHSETRLSLWKFKKPVAHVLILFYRHFKKLSMWWHNPFKKCKIQSRKLKLNLNFCIGNRSFFENGKF